MLINVFGCSKKRKVSILRYIMIFVMIMTFLNFSSVMTVYASDATVYVNTNSIIVDNYMGSGVQWESYNYYPYSQAQWDQLTSRIGYMSPAFVRIMNMAYCFVDRIDESNTPIFNWNSAWMPELYKRLDYCQANGIDVIIGENGQPTNNYSNLLLNPGFETGGLKNWTTSWSRWSVTDEDSYNSQYSAKLTGIGDYQSCLMQDAIVSPNTDYVFFFYAKSSMSIPFAVCDMDMNVVDNALSWTTANNTWTLYSLRFNSGDLNKVKVYWGDGGGVTYVDNCWLMGVQNNLVLNSGFEVGDERHWTAPAQYSISTQDKHSGNYSVKLTGTGDNGTFYQKVILKSNTNYTLSFYAKGDNSFLYYIRDADWNKSVDYRVTPSSSTWTKYTHSFNSGNGGFVWLSINDEGGNIYFDDFSITQDNKVQNPGFETGNTDSWVVGPHFSVTIEDKHSGDYSLKLTGTGDWCSVTQNISNMEEGYKYYTYSFWAKTSVEIPFKVGNPDNPNEVYATGWTNANNTWTRYSLTYSSGPHNKALIYIGDGGGTNYFDDFSFTYSGDDNNFYKQTLPADFDNTNPLWAEMIGAELDYLRNTKGYTCIKYYNLINEPNGYWTTVKSYNEWKTAVSNLKTVLDDKGLGNYIKIIGPDATGDPSWVDNTVRDIPDTIGAYDYHWYADYTNHLLPDNLERTMLNRRAVIDNKDPGKDLFFGEAGLMTGVSSGGNDYIRDYFYGAAMVDYLAQSIRAGVSGASAWMMEDSQIVFTPSWLCPPTPTLGMFQETGFWNAFGDVMGDPLGDDLRPWFYPWSLGSRLFPKGSKIVWASDSGINGVKVAAMKKVNGSNYDMSFIIVNDSDTAHSITLKVPCATNTVSLQQYNFFENDRPIDSNGFPVPKTTLANVNLTTGTDINLPSKSAIFLTTMEGGTTVSLSAASSMLYDKLDNWNNVYSHTSGLTFDTTNSGNFREDTSRLTRTSDTQQSIVYNVSGIKNFNIRVYYKNDMADRMLVWSSSDGINWTPLYMNWGKVAASDYGSYGTVNTFNDWYMVDYQTINNLPANQNFIKIQLQNDPNYSDQQIGEVKIFYN